MSEWDNLSDDELRAMSPFSLQARISLYALTAADMKARDPDKYLAIGAGLDRAVRIWKERGSPIIAPPSAA